MDIRKVAVIGAGIQGRAFALRCAQAGYKVVLEDVMPAKLRRAQDEFSDHEVSVCYASTVEDAVSNADLVIDFVPDELESKLEIFSMLDRMAPPRTVLLTPTNTLSITDLASCTYRSDRCVAVRTDAGKGLDGEALVLRSRFVDADVLAAVEDFLRKVQISPVVTDDVEQPQLVKNQRA